MNGGWSISYEIALRWMPLDLTDNKSTLVQVMAWCRQAHCLSLCGLDICHWMVSPGLNELINGCKCGYRMDQRHFIIVPAKKYYRIERNWSTVVVTIVNKRHRKKTEQAQAISLLYQVTALVTFQVIFHVTADRRTGHILVQTNHWP